MWSNKRAQEVINVPCFPYIYMQIVCHLIGKGGSVISKIEEESGAHVQFQQESEMEPGALGRILEIAGVGTSQSNALYLFCRKVQLWQLSGPLCVLVAKVGFLT